MPKTHVRVRSRRAVGSAGALILLASCSADNLVRPPSRMTSPVVANATERNFSFSVTAVDRTVRVRFTRVRSDGTESVSAFMQRVFASADAVRATRLVIDLSSTKGGDSFLIVPLVRGIIAREQFTRRGGLVIIVGPDTFSPWQNAAAVVQRYAQPIFVDGPAPGVL